MRGKLGELFDKLVSRLDLAAYAWAGFTALNGFATAHLAGLNTWIASFGPIGYWSCGLLGALVTALIGAAFARARLWWRTASAIGKWQEDVSGINPLDHHFDKRRIKLHDLVDPVRNEIKNKSFTDCELLGPANVLLKGAGVFNNVKFINCDIVPLIPKKTGGVFNCIVLDAATMVRGVVIILGHDFEEANLAAFRPSFAVLAQPGRAADL